MLSYMDIGRAICHWLFENANWIIPLLITALFSILNLITARQNIKLTKEQSKLQNEIAENQFRLQNNSFCYQLLDKRMAVYTSIQKIIACVLSESTISESGIIDFVQQTREVEFLFGDEVKQRVDELYRLLAEYHTVSTVVNDDIQRGKISSHHAERCERQAEITRILTDKQDEMTDVFAPYLSFKDYKIQTD